jgi:hypothetical protein
MDPLWEVRIAADGVMHVVAPDAQQAVRDAITKLQMLYAEVIHIDISTTPEKLED